MTATWRQMLVDVRCDLAHTWRGRGILSPQDMLLIARTPEEIEQAFQEGADPNDNDAFGARMLFGNNTIFWGNREAMLQRFVERGLDIHMTNDEGQSLLHSVADGAVVKALLKAGANPWRRDVMGQTPAMCAMMDCRWEALDALVMSQERDIRTGMVNSPSVVTALISLVRTKGLWDLPIMETLVDFLINSALNIAWRDEGVRVSLSEMLQEAAKAPFPTPWRRMIDDELRRGGAPNFTKMAIYERMNDREDEVVPFHYDNIKNAMRFACVNNDTLTVAHLLRQKVSGSLCDSQGQTPLHWAVREHGDKIVELLLEHGAPINATDCNLRTPLLMLHDKMTQPGWRFSYACQPDVVFAKLLGAGADIQAQDQRQRSLEMLEDNTPEASQSVFAKDHALTVRSHNLLLAMAQRQWLEEGVGLVGDPEPERRGRRRM